MGEELRKLTGRRVKDSRSVQAVGTQNQVGHRTNASIAIQNISGSLHQWPTFSIRRDRAAMESCQHRRFQNVLRKAVGGLTFLPQLFHGVMGGFVGGECENFIKRKNIFRAIARHGDRNRGFLSLPCSGFVCAVFGSRNGQGRSGRLRQYNCG